MAKYIGEKYDSALSLKEIAQKVRADLKKKLPMCKFSVTTSYAANCCALHVTLMSSPENALVEKPTRMYPGYATVNPGGIDTNDNLTHAGKVVMSKVEDIVESYHYEECDMYADYWRVNFWVHMAVGKYNKPYCVK